ncbi:putative nephrin [Operophtera brumata]|uniref:Putative nephrin n=1 Tax=Operophtera brumata TaxID=104452 RepID=A0A0L7KPX3_OPEBR|nr:putative nephrin [Operophtera brumata]
MNIEKSNFEGYKERTISDNNQVSIKNNASKENVKLKEINRHRRRLRSRTNTLYLLLRMTVEYKVMLKQWLLCILICSVSGYREQKFAMEPQDQSAVVGSRVILPCRVEGKSGQLQWTKDDFGLGTHRHLNGYERYRMIGSDEEEQVAFST